MKIKLSKYIKKWESKLSKRVKEVKALALEVNGLFKDNIGKDRITPKTIKKTGKTLYDTGLGQKSINTIVRKDLLKTGNSKKYMGYYLPSSKTRTKVVEKNWLIKPPNLDKIIAAWITEFIKK